MMKSRTIIQEQRLLTAEDAAFYCNVPKVRFPMVCPVRPISLYEGHGPYYCERDLDEWIDSAKAGISGNHDEILDKLPE